MNDIRRNEMSFKIFHLYNKDFPPLSKTLFHFKVVYCKCLLFLFSFTIFHKIAYFAHCFVLTAIILRLCSGRLKSLHKILQNWRSICISSESDQQWCDRHVLKDQRSTANWDEAPSESIFISVPIDKSNGNVDYNNFMGRSYGSIMGQKITTEGDVCSLMNRFSSKICFSWRMYELVDLRCQNVIKSGAHVYLFSAK